MCMTRREQVFKWPRRTCAICGRQIAVYPWSGCFVRHDPPGQRGVGAPLVSCVGSFVKAPAPDGSVQAELFHAQDVTPEHLWA